MGGVGGGARCQSCSQQALVPGAPPLHKSKTNNQLIPAQFIPPVGLGFYTFSVGVSVLSYFRLTNARPILTSNKRLPQSNSTHRPLLNRRTRQGPNQKNAPTGSHLAPLLFSETSRKRQAHRIHPTPPLLQNLARPLPTKNEARSPRMDSLASSSKGFMEQIKRSKKKKPPRPKYLHKPLPTILNKKYIDQSHSLPYYHSMSDIQIFPCQTLSVYACPHQTTYYDSLLNKIRKSTKSILCAQYVFSSGHTRAWQRSSKIMAAILDANLRGVTIQVLLDRPKPHSPNARTNIQTALLLQEKGVDVRTLIVSKTLHIKLIIIDTHTFFAGSHNLTNSSLYSPFELSWECIDPFLTNSAIAYFQCLWNGQLSEPYTAALTAFRKEQTNSKV